MEDRQENKLGREIMRLMKLSRETPIDDLLDAALEGRSKDADTVCRLFKFVRDWFGPEKGLRRELDSVTTKQYWLACSAFLKDVAGLDEKQLEEIRNPRSSGSILDEFREEVRL